MGDINDSPPAPHLVGDVSRLDAVSSAMLFEPAAQGWITQDRSAPATSATLGARLPSRDKRSCACFPMTSSPSWNG